MSEEKQRHEEERYRWAEQQRLEEEKVQRKRKRNDADWRSIIEWTRRNSNMKRKNIVRLKSEGWRRRKSDKNLKRKSIDWRNSAD